MPKIRAHAPRTIYVDTLFDADAPPQTRYQRQPESSGWSREAGFPAFRGVDAAAWARRKVKINFNLMEVAMMFGATNLTMHSVALCAASFVALAPANVFAAENPQGPTQAASITVSPDVPTDVPGGASNADIATAAAFAWQEFIALNWPAQAGGRDTPEKSALFGQNAAAGGPPLVWETFRHKIEIFPSREKADITNAYPLPQTPFNYNAPPAYFYVPGQVGSRDGGVAPCPGQTRVSQAAWINLDETSQIGLDQMYAGVLPAGAAGNNSAPQLIRFMAKANKTEYDYVLFGNNYYYHSQELDSAEKNFQKAVQNQVPPQPPFVSFPPGTIEVKSGWRPLAAGEDPSRFHTATVRFYEKDKNNSDRPCYFENQWALIALHIIQKTPSAPAFVFATFEQADNILTRDGKPVEDENGAIINPPSGGPTEPALTYKDAPPPTGPKVSVAGAYCTDIGKRLFYHELPGMSPRPSNTGLPLGGDICVNQRFNAIPSDIVKVNKAAHNAIADYNSKNNVQKSPWQYYKLVNVQAYPFDKSQIDGSNRSTFYLANSVVETDYTLQMFSGRLSGGAPTDYPPPPPPPLQAPPNAYVFSPAFHEYNMGGCQGCHGNAQVGGRDFSFILDGNEFQAEPETPESVSNKYSQISRPW